MFSKTLCALSRHPWARWHDRLVRRDRVRHRRRRQGAGRQGGRRRAGEVQPRRRPRAGRAQGPALPASQQVDCATGEALQYAITEPTSATGDRGLTYSPGTDRYQYVWKTEADWAGTCRELQIVLEDGTQHRAVFRFH
jgi:hypothetical protein